MNIFVNQKAMWSEEDKAFVMNFNGRVAKSSNKNFILVDEFDPERYYLLLGKSDEVNGDWFNLDITYPFSILQSFAFCITSFDTKISK